MTFTFGKPDIVQLFKRPHAEKIMQEVYEHL